MSIPILKRNDSGHLIFTRTPEIEYILEMTLDETIRMVQARSANIFVYEEDGQLHPIYQDEKLDEALQIARYCMTHRTPLNLKAGNVLNQDNDDPDVVCSIPTLCMYLTASEGDIGAIYLRNPIFFDHFFESDTKLIAGLGSAFSILITNGWRESNNNSLYFNFRAGLQLLMESAELHQQVKETDAKLKAVLQVSNEINSSRELNELILAVLYSAKQVIRAESASLFLLDQETEELVIELISGQKEDKLAGIRVPKGKGIVGEAALKKELIVVNDAQNDPRFYKGVDQESEFITRNLMASPLLFNGEVIGVVEVLNTIDRAEFTEYDHEIFKSFSESVAIAIQRRRLNDDLENSNKQLYKKLRETTSLHRVAEALVLANSIDNLYTTVLDIIINELEVGRASILIYNNASERLEMAAKRGNYTYTEDEDIVENKLSYHVFLTNKALYTNDLNTNTELKTFSQPGRYNTNSAIIIPMESNKHDGAFGVLCVSEPRAGEFLEEDFRLLKTITSQMVGGYEKFKMNEEILATQTFEKEVEITSKIQKNILPSVVPEHAYLNLAGRSVMAKTIGGDFYDYYVHGPNGEVTLLVADVSGKSLPAALFMALSSSILRTIIRSEKDLTTVMKKANDLLYEESHSGMFVTVFLARYEPRTSMLRFASAGHNEMILMRKNGDYELISGKGPPLGVVPNGLVQFEGGEIRTENNDLLVLYTDGIIEAINPQNEEFGMENFLKILKSNNHREPEDIIESTYNSVVQFSGSDLQYDDFTMVVSHFFGIVVDKRNYHIALPARKDSVPILRDFISDLCIKHGIDSRVKEDILVSIDEAATNIIEHAYRDITDKTIGFECDIFIEAYNIFRIEFRDSGKPFPIDNVKQPDINENLAGKRKGGFGVYLMKSLMDNIQYERVDNKNYLIAEKKLDGIVSP